MAWLDLTIIIFCGCVDSLCAVCIVRCRIDIGGRSGGQADGLTKYVYKASLSNLEFGQSRCWKLKSRRFRVRVLYCCKLQVVGADGLT